MKKIVIHKPGGYDTLKIIECPPIDLSDAEHLLVQVKYSGVNYADIAVRWGIYESAKKYVGYPITPGFEFSGIVKKVGSKVSNFREGDEVIGVSLRRGSRPGARRRPVGPGDPR